MRRHDFGRAISFLYGFNTLGAVAGALLGEAYFVQAFGLLGTSLVAGALNCVAAALAWLVAIVFPVTAEILSQDRPRAFFKIDYLPPWRLLFVSLATGGILLCLEVVWFRFLLLYVAMSATAFAVMLAVVLAGIGFGGVISGAIRRRVAQSKELLPILLFLLGIAVLLSYWFFPGPALQKRAGEWRVNGDSP